jgi:hypothetical protein
LQAEQDRLKAEQDRIEQARLDEEERLWREEADRKDAADKMEALFSKNFLCNCFMLLDANGDGADPPPPSPRHPRHHFYKLTLTVPLFFYLP